MKICHITSAHPPEDIRIFHKECVSLSKAGHEVYLVERGSSYSKFGVNIVGFGDAPKGRLNRITKAAKNAYKIAINLDCDVYHVHDPELLRYCLKLKKAGKKVIFDSHEDVPAQIMDKEWIPRVFRKMVSSLYIKYETKIVRKIDAVVTATPYIEGKFKLRNPHSIAINNFPKLDDIEFHDSSFNDRESIVCYAGAINENRGEKTMIEVMGNVDGQLIIAGEHEITDINNGKIRYVGKLNRQGVNDLYGRSVVGLCLLKATGNYVNSQPIKMYEYMAAGLPFICSDFPLWRKVAEESQAGICVDPNDIDQIAEIVISLFNNRIKAQKMGMMGRKYVLENCTWSNEERKLIDLYKRIETNR